MTPDTRARPGEARGPLPGLHVREMLFAEGRRSPRRPDGRAPTWLRKEWLQPRTENTFGANERAVASF